MNIVLFIACALVLVACGVSESETRYFVQISDPQLGFITESEDFSPEQANMECIAQEVNALSPDFVVFTGDYVQWRTDENALEGFQKMCTLFDEDIPLYFLPGNHDVGEATPEEMANYVARYGHDRFVFEGENYTTIGYNSCLIKSEAEGEAELYEWMEESLAKAAERELPIILAAHHPQFVASPEEENNGENLPLELRKKYLGLIKNYGVDLVLSGHLHHCVRAEWEGVRFATTSAAGRPLGDEGSGVTVVTIKNGEATPTFYEIGSIPKSVE